MNDPNLRQNGVAFNEWASYQKTGFWSPAYPTEEAGFYRSEWIRNMPDVQTCRSLTVSLLSSLQPNPVLIACFFRGTTMKQISVESKLVVFDSR